MTYQNENNNINKKALFLFCTGVFVLLWILPCFVFGFTFYGATTSLMNAFNESTENYIQAKAKVVDYESTRGDSKKYIAEYEVNGQKYRITSDFSTNIAMVQKKYGEEVLVKYNPQNPQESILEENMPNLFIWIFRIIGIVSFTVGILSIALVLYARNKIFNTPQYYIQE